MKAEKGLKGWAMDLKSEYLAFILSFTTVWPGDIKRTSLGFSFIGYKPQGLGSSIFNIAPITDIASSHGF